MKGVSKYDIYRKEIIELLSDEDATKRSVSIELAKKHNLNKSGLYHYLKQNDFDDFDDNVDVFEDDGVLVQKKEEDDKMEINMYSSFVKTLDDLIEYHKIDMNQFKVVNVETNYFEQGSKLRIPHQTPDGKVVIKHERTKTPLHQIKAKFILKEKIFDIDRFVVSLKDALSSDFNPKKVKVKKKADLLIEPFLTDHHIGNAVQNENYDLIYSIDIAGKYYNDAFESFLDRIDTSRIERFCLPSGNDLVHWDNFKNQTTAGTQLFGNARDYERACVVAEACLIRNIEKCSKIAPVDVVMVKSNHAYNTEFHIGRSLEYRFAKDPNVTIKNSINSRQYYQFHQVGIGFCHGHNEKIAELDKIFPVERPDLWHQSKTRHFHIGHRHKFLKSQSFTKLVDNMRMNGLEVIQGSTLCVPDMWHTNKGYVGSYQRTQCMMFNHEYLEDIKFFHPN